MAAPISAVNPQDWMIKLPFMKHEHGILSGVRNKHTGATIKVAFPRCRIPFELSLPMGVTVDSAAVHTKRLGLDLADEAFKAWVLSVDVAMLQLISEHSVDFFGVKKSMEVIQDRYKPRFRASKKAEYAGTFDVSVCVRPRTAKEKAVRVFVVTDPVLKHIAATTLDAIRAGVEAEIIAKVSMVWCGATGISVIFKATDILVHESAEEEANPFQGYSVAAPAAPAPAYAPATAYAPAAYATSQESPCTGSGSVYPAYGSLPPDFE